MAKGIRVIGSMNTDSSTQSPELTFTIFRNRPLLQSLDISPLVIGIGIIEPEKTISEGIGSQILLGFSPLVVSFLSAEKNAVHLLQFPVTWTFHRQILM